MQINNQIKYTGQCFEVNLIKEFGVLLNTDNFTLQNKHRYDYLLETMLGLAEYKNYSDAQYYLARHFLSVNDINNYKFWLMRAAKNNDNPHPLANLKVVKFCLEKHRELWSDQPEQAEKYLETARDHLNFIRDFTVSELEHRIDWLYVKEQADIIWQKEFAETTATAQIWLAPINCNYPEKHAYIAKFSQQTEKISIRFKDVLQRWKLKQQ